MLPKEWDIPLFLVYPLLFKTEMSRVKGNKTMFLV